MTCIRRLVLAVAAGALVCALPACATPSPSDSAPAGSGALASPGLPAGEVIGQGTVIDADGKVKLCLGPIAESYPPQCAGLPVTGWSWDDVEGYETAGDTRWGAYAVQGAYDGESLAVTQPPVLLALYDPMMVENPTGGAPGTADEDTLVRAQEDLPDAFGDGFLDASLQDGWVWVDVVWDDGTWQRAVDETYGADAVIVRSALRDPAG